MGEDEDSEAKTNWLDTELEYCTVSVQGETCKLCRPCREGWGYKFDCTNVDKRIVQSHCIELHVIGSFMEGQSEMAFLPVLDKN